MCQNQVALDAADWIACTDIVVTLLFGVIVTVLIGKRLSNNRATKDYFINTLSEFSRSYDQFIFELINGKLSTNDIKTWFKIHTMYAMATGRSIKKQYGLNLDQITSINNDLKQSITDTDEFNDQYDKEALHLKHATITSIVEKVALLRENIADVIIDINKK